MLKRKVLVSVIVIRNNFFFHCFVAEYNMNPTVLERFKDEDLLSMFFSWGLLRKAKMCPKCNIEMILKKDMAEKKIILIIYMIIKLN